MTNSPILGNECEDVTCEDCGMQSINEYGFCESCGFDMEEFWNSQTWSRSITDNASDF